MHFNSKRITPAVENSTDFFVTWPPRLAYLAWASNKQANNKSLPPSPIRLSRAQHMQALPLSTGKRPLIHTKSILTKGINRDTDILIAP